MKFKLKNYFRGLSEHEKNESGKWTWLIILFTQLIAALISDPQYFPFL